ncbi:MAG TPA: serine/threonine-protein kinase [Verrucomicrobiae bacterium]
MKCTSCGSLITKTESIVTRDSFHQALNRARKDSARLDSIVCGGHDYHLMQTLGVGAISQIYLARRISSLPLLATIKLSTAHIAAAQYAREAEVLRELQDLGQNGDGAYFSRLIPEVISQGVVEGQAGKQALVFRHPRGFWGSLASLNERFASGVDPRHAVWIWRRILEMLGFIHKHGWVHGDIRPEHALVHPQDHGVRLVGWVSAKKGASNKERTTDLCRSARVIHVLLCGTNGSQDIPGNVPDGLARLVSAVAKEESFCDSRRAEDLDTVLKAEAKAAFGPPAFVPLTI